MVVEEVAQIESQRNDMCDISARNSGRWAQNGNKTLETFTVTHRCIVQTVL